MISAPRDQPSGSSEGPWPLVLPPAPPHLREGPQPTFSVVVAAFQAARTLPAALESALSQSYPAMEVIVCDDGSTDDTADVLQTIGGTVTVLRQHNQGEAAAKNAAVRFARGDYVVVLDADDVFLPRRLEALAWLAVRRPDLDVLTTNAFVEADGVLVRCAYHAGWPFPRGDQRSAILDRNFVFGLCAVRRHRWLAVGGFDVELAHTADWEFWQRLILDGSRVGLVDEPLARYRLSTRSLSAHRCRLVQARLVVLSRAAAREDLVPHERAVVAGAIRRERRELIARRAEASLQDGGWRTRKRFAQLLVARGFGIRARLGALLALASPSAAAWRRSRRSDGLVEVGAGVRVRSPSDPGRAQPSP